MNDSFERAEDRSLVEPEPRRRRAIDPDPAYDNPDNWPEQERNAAIGARSALMREAALERVAEDPPDTLLRWTGRLLETARDADPVGEWLAEDARLHPYRQANLVRLMVRAVATPPDRASNLLLASAIDAAASLAQDCARSIAWDMAEAAEREEA